MTLWSSFFGVAFAVLALGAPWMVARFGPGSVYLAHAAWMLVVAVLLWVLMPRDPAARVVRTQGLMAQHRRIYASPWISAPAMGFFCYTFLYVALLTLLPPAVSLDLRGLAAAGMPLMSIAVSMTFGVWLLGRLSAVRVVQMGYLAAVPGFVGLALVWGQGLEMVLAGLWLAAALGVVQGASFAAIPELNPDPEARAQSAGAIAQLGNLGTTTGTPVLVAVLAGAGPWGMAVVACAACAIGIGLHLMQARRRSFYKFPVCS
jgi:hypothetical protein